MVVLDRTENEISDFNDLELAGVEPLTLEDITFKDSYVNQDVVSNEQDSLSGGGLFSVTMAALLNKKRMKSKKSMSNGKKRWLKAVKLIKDRGDPWEKFNINAIRTEKGRRHRYNPVTQKWVVDECILKLDKEPFAHGAMRECYRMKKLSNFSNSNDWARDSNNFVAKKYMEEDTPREMYFDDVKLQMDAKLWGEEYNRHNPPKKVDIFMMAVIELVDRPGSPLYHIEHYIDGEYIKYNSNSGYVADCRQTPQAFSHFTFERSGHQLMVVDIQGVGDLYTDPQIHTASGTEYGDGNLGTKGMALFFHSHKCNDICLSLGLSPFDLSTNELNDIKNQDHQPSAKPTMVKLDKVLMCESPSQVEKLDFSRFFRNRSGSCGFVDYEHKLEKQMSQMSVTSDLATSPPVSSDGDDGVEIMFRIDESEDTDNDSRAGTATSVDSGFDGCVTGPPRQRRVRTITECTQSDSDKIELRNKMNKISRPSCVFHEMRLSELNELTSESVLGNIHLDLAQYHEACRFHANVQDKVSAHFHLKCAADCENKQALIAISSLYTGLPNDILPALTQADVIDLVSGDIQDIGLDYMISAARRGDTYSKEYLAKAFDSGCNLGTRERDYSVAMRYYAEAVEAGAERRYLLIARQAEICLMSESECHDPNRAGELYSEAAEVAMEEMAGKLATKYYALAEEAWSLVEE